MAALNRSLFIRVMLLSTLVASTAAAADRVALQSRAMSAHQRMTKLAPMAATDRVSLSLVARLDQHLMDQLLDRLYGPHASPTKHFLTASEFAQAFDLAGKRQKLKEFAAASGLAVDGQDRPESMVVKVSGPAERVQRAFGVHLDFYKDANGQTFHAHDTDPTVPSALAPHISAVLGLSNFAGARHTHLRLATPAQSRGAASHAVAPAGISGATGPAGLAPADIETIYKLPGGSLTGTGQVVGIVEFDGYSPADIAFYESHFSLPSTNIAYVGVDGTANVCNGANCATQTIGGDPEMPEVALDIEMVTALAPNSQIIVYNSANTNQGSQDALDQIASDDLANVVSTSWGLAEDEFGPPSTMSAILIAEMQTFQRMAVQGQSMFAASGDNGAFDDGSTLSVDDPGSQPYVTSVGGTSLGGTLTSPTETTWFDSLNGDGSGGGVSSFWAIPPYQAGVAGEASQTMRNVPDVALNADPNSPYSIYVAGQWRGVGGTSVAAPLWAAMAALINQQRAADGAGSWGLANSQIYQLAASTSYPSAFTDVTTGNNGHYNAGAGYDNSTGWGSYKANAFIGLSTATIATVFITTPPGVENPLEALANVYAYPNPWDIRADHARQITFANLPPDATVKIFTLSGFLVKTLSVSGSSAVWDLTNDGGKAASSGLYLFLASDAGNQTTGKIAIIK